jgi:Uma2 family endonuclease
MVELKIGLRSVDLPYAVRVYGVTEAMFDELADEDTKAELFDGVMIVHSPASLRHDYVGGFLRDLISFYAGGKDLGTVLGPDSLVHLKTCRKFGPAIFFVRKGRVRFPLPKQFEGTPDLVVEVLSPSNRADDLEDKRPAYREAGVKELWFVDLDRERLLVDRKGKRGYTETVLYTGRVTSTVLDGFWVEAAWLWAEPLPNPMTCLQKILREKPGRAR